MKSEVGEQRWMVQAVVKARNAEQKEAGVHTRRPCSKSCPLDRAATSLAVTGAVTGWPTRPVSVRRDHARVTAIAGGDATREGARVTERHEGRERGASISISAPTAPLSCLPTSSPESAERRSRLLLDLPRFLR